jgi:bla regulator protein BlaR1
MIGQMSRARSIGLAMSLGIHLLAAAVLLQPRGFVTGGPPEDGPPRERAEQAKPAAEAHAYTPAVIEIVGDRPAPAGWDPRNGLLHVLQSTAYAIAAGLLTLAFRRNHARVRYWLWFSASAKFFVPCSLLVMLGGRLPLPVVEVATLPAATSTMAQIGHTFLAGGSSSLPVALPTASAWGWVPLLLAGIWGCGFLTIGLMRLRMWQRVRRAVRASMPMASAPIALPPGVEMRAAPGVLEPGVVGLWQPIILVPAGIETHLPPAQFGAVLTHEVCHIRRRDNLTAALHMLVEAVFWFHPMVWWIGARLVDERERACDEEVLRVVDNPRSYADGIVNVCKRYVEAPLSCVSGVSGSNLIRRIEVIMSNRIGEAVPRSKQLVIALAAVVAVGLPVVAGIANAPRLRAQVRIPGQTAPAFDSVSVKSNTSGRRSMRLEEDAGGLIGTNVTTAMLVRFAYDLPSFQVVGGPEWLNSEHFDVIATAAGDPSLDQKRLMLRRLLTERFQLAAHTETRDLPVYALMTGGTTSAQLRRSAASCAESGTPEFRGLGLSPAAGPPACGFFGFAPGTDFPSGKGGLAFRGLTMGAFAKLLVQLLNHSVSDRTSLDGYFDGEFDFVAELPLPPPPPGTPNPFRTPFASVTAVLPSQLGLRLEPQRGPVNVLAIDRAERPKVD